MLGTRGVLVAARGPPFAPHGSTIVELPAQGPGEVRFTCAMGRYRGLIRLTEEQRGSPGLRARLRRVRVPETVAGAGLAVATTGLPAIAIPIRVVDAELLLRAVETYDTHRLDFVDAYLVASAERTGVGEIVSFGGSTA